MDLLAVGLILIIAVACLISARGGSDAGMCLAGLAIAFCYVLFTVAMPVEPFDSGIEISDFINRAPDQPPFESTLTVPVTEPILWNAATGAGCAQWPRAAPGGYDVDIGITERARYLGGKNKAAIDGAVRSGRYLFEKYYADELKENEDRDWWSAQAQPLETDFWSFY